MDTETREKKSRLLTSILMDPFRQIKFGVYMIGISLAFVAATAVIFISAFYDQYKHVMGIFNIVDPEIQWGMILNDVFYTNAVRLGVFFILFLISIFFIVFRLTHRYYGPLVSIERFVEEMIQGRYEARVSIRSKDELQDLVKKLNLLAEALDKKHGNNSSQK